MGNGRDSDRPGALNKNGHEQLQDRAIKELHSEFLEHIKDEVHHHTAVEKSVDAVAAKLDKFLFGSRIVAWFIGIMMGGVLAYQVSIDIRMGNMQDNIEQLSAKQHAFEERGTKWGQDLDQETSDIRQDIRELRRMLNDHQRDNQSHRPTHHK